MKKVLVIAGLTASGKSALGINLAQAFNGEVISADSVAVYKELNIGSAKTRVEERDGITHHLIDIGSIYEPYNVARFQKEARSAIDDITSRGKLPIVVGGTGLYINALVKDYRFELETLGNEPEDDRPTDVLYEELKDKDELSSLSIHPNNRKRILRALESVNYHKETRKDLHQDLKNVYLYDAKIFFLQGDREKIYGRIEARVDAMIEQGLVEEVRSLFNIDNDLFSLQSMQSIGYREFKEYFLGNQDLDRTVELIKRNTRRFAKRQMTWFKHQTESEWVDIFNPNFENEVIGMTTTWVNDDE